MRIIVPMKKLICFFLTFVALSGAFLWAQKWQQVAVLVIDVSRDESDLSVSFVGTVAVDRLILVESRDGSIRDSYAVKHVLEKHVLLKQRLRHEFLAGSRIYQ